MLSSMYIKVIPFLFFLISVMFGCGKKAFECGEGIANPFNNMFLEVKNINVQCLISEGFELKIGDPEINHLIYEKEGVGIVIDIMFNDSYFERKKLEDGAFEIYGLKYVIREFGSLDIKNVRKKMEGFDADLISEFITEDQNTFYFFIRHRYNNLVFKCVGDKGLNQLEIPFKVPILNSELIEKRKKMFDKIL